MVPFHSFSLLCFKVFVYLALPGFSCGTHHLHLQHVGSRSLTRNRTQALCVGSMESQPLDHQESLLAMFTEMDVFEMDVLAIKSLIPGIYTTIKKLKVTHLQSEVW